MKIDQVTKEKGCVMRLALKNLAEDEHWSGYTDERLWAKAIGMTASVSEDLRPAVSEDCVLYTHLLRQEGLKKVVDRYCQLRGEEILTEIQTRNTELQEKVKQVKEVHKLYIRHYRFDHLNNTSRHSSKYLLALLIVILIAVLLGGNGP